MNLHIIVSSCEFQDTKLWTHYLLRVLENLFHRNRTVFHSFVFRLFFIKFAATKFWPTTTKSDMKILKRLINMVVFLGKQEFTFRSHDGGKDS